MARLRLSLLLLLAIALIGLLSACSGASPDANLPSIEPSGADAGNAPIQATVRIVTTGVPKTSENGGTATFTVALGLRPIADVVLPIASSKDGEIKVEPSALTFGPDDWDKAKTVTLIGQDDAVDDGDQKVVISLGPTSSADTAWNGVKVDPIEAVNTDDDAAGIDVSTPSPTSNTTENGAEATFTVKLKSRPTADVTVAVSSTVPTEGKADKTQLVFAPNTWQIAQTVKVRGQDDSVADGDKPFKVVLEPQSADMTYAALGKHELSFTNLDDDIPGFFVFPPAVDKRTTTEAGGTTSFTVRLRSKPTADVTVPVSSSKPGEGLPSAAQLVFTPATYDQPQTVTVTGQNDFVDDGDQTYTVLLGAATSADGNYDTLNPPDVDLTNVDDDTAAILVSALSPNNMTTEAGGAITFTVRLASEPTGTVTIGVSSSKPTEGLPDVTQLVFDAASWNTPQTVTVTGQDDFVDDNNQSYSIVLTKAVSADAKYAAIDPADLALVNVDDDTAGIAVSAPSPGTQTTEAGGKVTVDVVLQSQPTGNVTIPVSVSNAAEATIDKTQLVFTTANWNIAQTITVTGKDDFVDDGDVAYNLVLGVASGGGYDGINPADVALSNVDDDTKGVAVSAPSPGTQTTEAGGKVTVDVVLQSQPTGNVTIPVSVSNTAEASADKTQLVFTTANWNVVQTITVTGKDDLVDDGDVDYLLVLGTATGGGYAGINPADVALVNADDDTLGITVSAPAPSNQTTEAGGKVTVTVVLQSQPTGNVTIPVSVSNTDEATADKTELVFTPANWNVAQTITVTGKDDAVVDGDVAYDLALGTASGGGYDGVDPNDVSLVNLDDDVPVIP